MVRIDTRDFGPIDYDPAAELLFPHGLPGFDGQTRFVLIQKESFSPLAFLQSVQSPALCFITVPVHVVDPGYQIGMTEDDHRTLAWADTKPSELLLLAIVAASSAGQASANLAAPVAINLVTRTGLQAIRPDRRYSHQHPLPEVMSCPA